MYNLDFHYQFVFYIRAAGGASIGLRVIRKFLFSLMCRPASFCPYLTLFLHIKFADYEQTHLQRKAEKPTMATQTP
jgi:hypothetical protein